MEQKLLEELNALPPEEKAAKLIELHDQAEERLKKREAEMEVWVTKLKDRDAYNELIKDKARLIIADKDNFADILTEDEVLAKAVLDEYFWGITIEEALAQVDEWKKIKLVDKQKDKSLQDNVTNLVNETLTKRDINNQIKWFIKELSLNEEEKKIFMSEFEDLTEWKKLDETKLDKYLNLALKESFPDYNANKIEEQALDIAWRGWNISWNKSSQQGQIRKANIQYLKDRGII